MIEEIEYLLPIKFCQFQHSGSRGEAENVSANERKGWPSLMTDLPEIRIGREEGNYLLPVKLRQIQQSGCRGDVENVKANQKQGQPSLMIEQRQKHKLGRGH